MTEGRSRRRRRDAHARAATAAPGVPVSTPGSPEPSGSSASPEQVTGTLPGNEFRDALVGDGVKRPSTAPPRARWQVAVGVVGEVLITLGVLALLMVVYQLFWTNVVSAQAISAGRDEILQGWRDDAPTPAPSPTPMAAPAYGTGFALLYIPKMKDKVWGLPIYQGTDKDILAKGAGHYVGTAMPGGIGNFAIAAHRSTHDEPFANIDVLRAGDKVYVRTADWWYVYTLVKDDPNLKPTDVWVVDPVPGHPGAKPEQALLTMTTCTPRYGSTGRWAWWGSLTGYSATPPDGIDPNH